MQIFLHVRAFERMFEYHRGMATSPPDFEHLLREALESVADGPGTSALISRLQATASAQRALERIQVDLVAALLQARAFAVRGYKRPESALANLLDIGRADARRLVVAAESVCPQVTSEDEHPGPALPATAAAFTGGEITLRHVGAVASALASRAAARLAPRDRIHAEDHIATLATQLLPRQLSAHANSYLELLDREQNPSSDPPRVEINELRCTRDSRGGGKITARYDDPVRFETILAVIDAKSAPLTADDDRTAPERQADALADVCGFVAEHGDKTVLPEHRPTIAVTVQLTDLEERAAAGSLALGGTPSPEALRRMCCDAGVIPAVLGGSGQPLDIGRRNRGIPESIRRAVQIRDRGCAHPGCDRPASWSEIHHVIAWSDGGPTSTDNCVMLCRVHHREVHTTGWGVRIAPDGIPEFIPPPWIDPERRPRRHPRHQAMATRRRRRAAVSPGGRGRPASRRRSRCAARGVSPGAGRSG
jgi:hypothetical protein